LRALIGAGGRARVALLCAAIAAVASAGFFRRALVARRCGEPAAPPGSFELYVVGDSTPAGVAYGGDPAFPMLVVQVFDGRIAGRPVFLRNLAQGGAGIGAQNAAFERSLACRDRTEPGALLVYAGHNDSAGPIAAYERHLRAIVARAVDERLEPILALPVSNIAGLDPGLGAFPAERFAALQERLNGGSALERKGAWREAAAYYEAGRSPASDDFDNYLDYRRALCLRRAGDRGRAERLFWGVVEHASQDAFGRARPSIHAVIRAVARERGAAIVDAVELFERDSPDGVIDDRFFLDGQHPNARGTALLADGFARALSTRLREPIKRRFAGTFTEEALPKAKRAAALVQAGRWLLSVARGHGYPYHRLQLARRSFQLAAALARDDFSARLGLAIVEAERRSDGRDAAWRRSWLEGDLAAWGARFTVSEGAFPDLLRELEVAGVSRSTLREVARTRRLARR
jgi:hypothetical protein